MPGVRQSNFQDPAESSSPPKRSFLSESENEPASARTHCRQEGNRRISQFWLTEPRPSSEKPPSEAYRRQPDSREEEYISPKGVCLSSLISSVPTSGGGFIITLTAALFVAVPSYDRSSDPEASSDHRNGQTGSKEGPSSALTRTSLIGRLGISWVRISLSRTGLLDRVTRRNPVLLADRLDEGFNPPLSAFGSMPNTACLMSTKERSVDLPGLLKRTAAPLALKSHCQVNGDDSFLRKKSSGLTKMTYCIRISSLLISHLTLSDQSCCCCSRRTLSSSFFSLHGKCRQKKACHHKCGDD